MSASHLFQPGNPYRWQPGKSPNPGGFTKSFREVRALAREDVKRVYPVIVEAALGGDVAASRLVFQIAGYPLAEKAPQDEQDESASELTAEAAALAERLESN